MRDYNALLPVHGRTFDTISQGPWEAVVLRWPCPSTETNELLCYELSFQQASGSGKRRFKLWVYLSDLSINQSCSAVIDKLSDWLEWEETDGELTMTVDASTRTLRVKRGPPV
jgi:hypothetical protein